MDHDSTAIYGLIGYPLGHSFSKDFFTEKFRAEGINARYLNFEIPDIDMLMEVIAEYPTLKGLNVTIPYKSLVIPYMTDMDPAAAAIGAVNVIRITGEDPNLHLKGYNTDCIGFSESLRPLLRPDMTNALVLGTGGASKAAVYALQELGISVTRVSRTAAPGVITYQDLTPEVMERNLIIVNATPLGMYPDTDTCPDIPYSMLTPRHLCYDIVYNPTETKFMRLASQHGSTVKNGLEMLHLQALAAWKIWNQK
ncbi:MAG: shikimate dehydrogenase [Muribaculaceae bacterium]|nr:shikimate dehydrogenase [Muribaculaceae bacterium]